MSMLCFARVGNQTNLLHCALVPIPKCKDVWEFAPYRRVSIVANIGSTDVKKCLCRPSRNSIPPARRCAHVINVIRPSVKNKHIVLLFWIHLLPSWMTMNWSHVLDFTVFVETTTKSYFVCLRFHTCFPIIKIPNWRSVRILCNDTSKFSKVLLHLIHEVLVNVLIFWSLSMKCQTILWKYLPHRRISLHFLSPIRMNTGTSAGTSARALAEFACLYGIGLTGILIGTALTGIPFIGTAFNGVSFGFGASCLFIKCQLLDAVSWIAKCTSIDRQKTTISTKLSHLQGAILPFFNKICGLTFLPLVRIPIYFEEFPRDNAAGVSSRS